VRGAAPWGATRLGAAVGWRDPSGGYRPGGRRDPAVDSRGGGSRGVRGPRGAGAAEEREGSSYEEGAHQGEDQQQQINYSLVEF
jgi:hypothetical protein